MKIAIVGSRDYPDRARVEALVQDLPDDVVVVTGGAVGVDRWAESVARSRGLEVEVILPDWQRYGRAAGPIRNKAIVEAADRVVAFWDGRSRGTRSTIELARKAGKPVEVVGPPQVLQ